MRTLRRLSLLTALTIGVVCGVLLLNITAPNPTGRRYSSQTPLTTGEGSAGQLGGDGERILGGDLGLPNNNLPDQKQCVCGLSSPVPGGCNLCVAHSPLIANYRIPDFVGPNFIAEAKNVRQLLVTHDRDFQQISEIAAAAREAGMPFWVFVRVDTLVDPAYLALFEGMQGGIVYYFAVPGYVDMADSIAQVGLVLALLIVGVLLAWDLLTRKRPPADEPPTPKAPKRRARPDPMRKATDAEDFAQRMKDRARRDIDAPNGGNGSGKHH